MSALPKTTKFCTSSSMKTSRPLIAMLLVAAAAFVAAGCKSEDELSTRPWSTPKSWESGLPAGLTEGR